MCILMYWGPNAMPDRDHLMRGTDNNPDGFGFAVVRYVADEIVVGRGMNPDQVVDEFMTVRAEYPQDAALFHARIATTGSVCEGNCHPFEVQHRVFKSSGVDRVRAVRGHMILAHNGVLPCNPPAGDDRSDTKMFAEDILMRRFPHLDSTKTRRRIESYIGHSKVIVLTTDPAYRRQSYIFNSKLGTWFNDSDTHHWYSNGSWQSSYYRYSGAAWSYSSGAGLGYKRSGAESWDWDDDKSYENARISYPGTDLRMACTRCYFSLVFCACPGPVTAAWVPGELVDVPKHWAASSVPLDEQVEEEVPSWTCKSCETEASVGDDAKCTACGVMYCCDLPQDRCCCWDPASGRLRSQREIDDARAHIRSKALVPTGASFAEGVTALRDALIAELENGNGSSDVS